MSVYIICCAMVIATIVLFRTKFKIGSGYHEKIDSDNNKKFEERPIIISFVDFLMLKIWFLSFRFNKKIRDNIIKLLKMPEKSYLRTKGFLNDRFIYEFGIAYKDVKSKSFKELTKNRGKKTKI